ncbi:hypothetical protein EDC01DRAFT_674790 [Geopyxis carbonaria]|nr:hypothetical protein EDC01DRAFT_674790 [Geopyxis carbonaria]
MLPLPIADAAAAVRICGRRVVLRRPLARHVAAAASARRHPNENARPPDVAAIDRAFVNALVRASLCREHQPARAYSTLPAPPPPPPQPSTTSPPPPPLPTSDTETLPPPPPPPPAHKPRLWRSIFQAKPRPRALPWRFVGSLAELEALRRFRKALEHEAALAVVYEAYAALPGARLPLLTGRELDKLLTRFMTVPIRDQTTMLQYLSIIDDMNTCALRVTVNEWNQAISFITKASKYTSAAEVRAAFELFSQAEKDHGFRPNITTFNILLYGAMKSGSVQVVDQLLVELRRRELAFDRFTYTTLITHCGITGDSQGASDVYKNMVAAGEIIDTAVLNALMTALLRCEKLAAAEQLYTYMKTAGSKDPRPPLLDEDWQIRRSEAQQYKDYSSLRRAPNKVVPRLGPDAATFGLLTLSHSLQGNWDGVQAVLADMAQFGVPVGRSTYAALLRGFAWHGPGAAAWSRPRLEGLLRDVMDARIEWNRQMCIAVVKAVAKCYDEVGVLEKVWAEIGEQMEAQGGTMHETARQTYEDARNAYYGEEAPVEHEEGHQEEPADESWETQLRKVFLDG